MRKIFTLVSIFVLCSFMVAPAADGQTTKRRDNTTSTTTTNNTTSRSSSSTANSSRGAFNSSSNSSSNKNNSNSNNNVANNKDNNKNNNKDNNSQNNNTNQGNNTGNNNSKPANNNNNNNNQAVGNNNNNKPANNNNNNNNQAVGNNNNKPANNNNNNNNQAVGNNNKPANNNNNSNKGNVNQSQNNEANNHANHNHKQTYGVPSRSEMPSRSHWERPTAPTNFKSTSSSPSFSTILGVALGSAIDYTLSSLVTAGYSILSYTSNAVYLSDVKMLNYTWPNTTLYYTGDALHGSEFSYSTTKHSLTRYNAVYNSLVRQYGAPVSVNNAGTYDKSCTWWGDDNRYIVLSYYSDYAQNGKLRYYTTLSFGN